MRHRQLKIDENLHSTHCGKYDLFICLERYGSYKKLTKSIDRNLRTDIDKIMESLTQVSTGIQLLLRQMLQYVTTYYNKSYDI
jgi:hypothetical protein